MKVNQTFVPIFAAFLMSLAIPVHAQNVVTDWNSIASTTIVANGGKTPASASVWFAYASIAAYDAVNAIEHRGDPFYFHGSAARNASKEAAVLAAEHRILVNYFPMQQTMLDLDYTVSLAAIPGTPSARAEGVAVGEKAAAAVIAARAGMDWRRTWSTRRARGRAFGSQLHQSFSRLLRRGWVNCVHSR